MTITGCLRIAPLLAALAAAPSHAGDIDRTAVDFTMPAHIKWVRNPPATGEQAVQRVAAGAGNEGGCAWTWSVWGCWR